MSHSGHHSMGHPMMDHDAHQPQGNDSSMDHHMMMMYFHTNIGHDYVLFEFWQPKTVTDMIWTCVVIAVVAFVYEGIKYFREFLLNAPKQVHYTINGNGSSASVMVDRPVANVRRARTSILSLPHVIQTVLHVIQFLISYLLMLVFMTYNVWLCVSVLAGAGLGYFCFGWYRHVAVDITEHCH